MKKIVLAISALLFLQTIDAQVKEGKITYEQVADLHRRIPEDNVQMRQMVPHFRTSKFEMLFADNQSLYKAIEEEPDLADQNPNGGVVIRMGGGADNVYFRNYSTQQATDSRELMDEVYLVQDSIHNIKWKLEDTATKTILGYTCKQASGKTERGSNVIAWYSEEIPVAAGPDQFTGLPGLILCVDVNKGEIVYTATTLDKKLSKKDIKAPTKGKKMTGAEFAAKQKEVMGNGGPVRIVTN